MVEDINITVGRVKYSGIFSFDDYYKLLYDLFRSLGYDIEEAKYSHKTSPTGDSATIEWNCYKKVDDYSQFKIWAKTEINDLEKVQVQSKEQVLSRNKGSCYLEMKANIMTDYENRWEINPILKFLKGFYDVYFYKSTFDTWKAKVALDLHTVENEAKAFFNMQRFM